MSLLPTRNCCHFIALVLSVLIATSSALIAQESTLNEESAPSTSASLASQWETPSPQSISLQWNSLAQAIEAEAAGRTLPVAFQTELSAASGPNDPVRQAFADSLAAEKAQNYDDAIKLLDDVEGVDEHRYFVHARLGWLNYLKGDFTASIENYRHAVSDNPQSIEALAGWMLPLIASEKYDELIEVANQTLELEPYHYLASLRLAFALRSLKRLEESAEVTAGLLERLPTDLDALAAHALTLLELKRKDEATETLHRMLLIDPNNAFAIEKLDVAKQDLQYQAEPEDSSGVGEESVATDARLAEIRAAFNRSRLAEKAVRYDDAIQELMSVGDIGKDRYFVLVRLGWLHYLRGNFGKACYYYRQAIETEPEAIEAKVAYLLPLLASKQFQLTVDVAQQVLAVDSRNYFANLRLAIALREMKRYQESLATSERLVSSLPSDIEAMTEYSKNLVAVGRSEDAKAIYHRILLIDPENYFALVKLGLKPPINDYIASSDDYDVAPKLIRSISPYYAHIDYGSKSIKQLGNVGGLFFRASYINSLEMAAEYTDIRYRSGYELYQTDLITNYNYLELENLRLRIGGRVTSSNNDFIDASWVAFLGAHAYKSGFWDIGADTFVSQYDNLGPNKTIFQLTPHVGVETKPSPDTRVRLDFRTYYINTDSRVVSLGKSNFYSTEGRLQIDYAPWSFALFGWTGEQTFAVRNDGYIVFSLAELHTGGYGLELNRTFNESAFMTLRFNDEKFSDFQTMAPTQSDVYAMLFTFLW